LSESMNAGAPVLAVRGAHKTFGKLKALEDATLELFEGERLALLGPNGAGKTTLLRSVTGRVRLDRGAIELFGHEEPPEARRRAIGVVPQEIASTASPRATSPGAWSGRCAGPGSPIARSRWCATSRAG